MIFLNVAFGIAAFGIAAKEMIFQTRAGMVKYTKKEYGWDANEKTMSCL